MAFLIRFGQFWYDFIVGDSVILAIGGVLALVVAFVLVRVEAQRIAEITLPVIVLATLAASVPPAKRS